MRLIKVLMIFGTRPEAIKLAPLIRQFSQDCAFELRICVTAQHRQMLDQVLALFEITPDIDLDLMQPAQSLNALTTRILSEMPEVLARYTPDLVVVHGDTTTAFVAALSAYYQHIPIAHIEAGLRTHNLHSPFPEEANRRLIAQLAQWHFAPTESAKQHLIAEGVPESQIWVTGNTVIDALHIALQKMAENPALVGEMPFLEKGKKRVLVTAHRRENLNAFSQICEALAQLAMREDIQILYPVHPNPELQNQAHQRLAKYANIVLLPPQDYLPFLFLMNQADLILTDSGGIQEEAPALGKSVVLMRDVSERTEAVGSGMVRLVGTETDHIVAAVEALLDSPVKSLAQSVQSQRGASAMIVRTLKQEWQNA